MTLNEYQEAAMKTCLPSSQNLSYMLLGLNEEVGELSGKVAKLIRKGKVFFSSEGDVRPLMFPGEKEEAMEAIAKELGDVAWMLAGCCKVLGFSLEDICQKNIDKLADRAKRGVIDSQGDNR